MPKTRRASRRSRKTIRRRGGAWFGLRKNTPEEAQKKADKKLAKQLAMEILSVPDSDKYELATEVRENYPHLLNEVYMHFKSYKAGYEYDPFLNGPYQEPQKKADKKLAKQLAMEILSVPDSDKYELATEVRENYPHLLNEVYMHFKSYKAGYEYDPFLNGPYQEPQAYVRSVRNPLRNFHKVASP